MLSNLWNNIVQVDDEGMTKNKIIKFGEALVLSKNQMNLYFTFLSDKGAFFCAQKAWKLAFQ